MNKKPIILLVIIQLVISLLGACGQKGPLPPSDKIPPRVSLISPTNGAQSVPVNCSVVITFSEEMDASTINDQTITISTGNGNVQGSVTYFGTSAIFKPASDLNPATIHTVTVDGNVEDTAGNAMATPFGYIFITGAAEVPTTISLGAADVSFDANGIVTITVSSGGGIPIGYVSLSVDGGTAIVQELTGGSTTFTIPSPSAGTHTLNATYAAQGSFGSSSASGTLLVNQAATTTAIAAPAVTFGADGSVTVTVSSAAGTPTGSVSLSVDNGAATTQGLIGGSATFTIPGPGAGTHTLNATYAAQGNYGASSASGTLGVGVGVTTMTLSAPGVTYGADGIVTVTVSSAAGTPTGNVSLRVNNGAATTQGLVGGVTAFTIPGPSAGSYTLHAAYAAQGAFGASSASGTLIVNQAATTTTIAAPVVTYGADGSVTVTVSSAAGTPTGNVSLSVDGGTAMEQGLIDGSTTFTIPSPSIGSHTLNATYVAQGNFGASLASGTLGVGVGATAMTLNAPEVTYGANGIVTVTVSSAAGTPTGGVSLSIDNGAATTQGLIDGSTTFTIPGPNAGSYTLHAAYAAQGNFGASAASGTLIVNQAATTTEIAAPPVTYGADGSVTVMVSSAVGTPTGSVSLSVDNGAPMTQSLSSGSKTFTIPGPSVGSHALNAAYAAQGNYGASLASGTLGVGVGATAMTLTAPEVTYGANGSVMVTVSSAAGTPTGNVSLSVDGGTATEQELIGGSSTFTIPGPSAGSYTLQAAYAAQGNFGASAASGTLIVNQAATTTAITAPEVTYGADGSVTVTVSSAAGTPTGSVSLTVDNGAPMTQALSSGSTTFTIPGPSAGSYTLQAVYAAQGNFGASTAAGTLDVNKASQTITFGALTTKTFGAADFNPGATASSGLPVLYTSSNTLVATIVDDQIHIVGAGSTTITAFQTGDGNYNAAQSATQDLTVNKADQTITFGPLTDSVVGDPQFTLEATASSGLTVSYTSSEPTVATIVAGDKVRIEGAGTTTITASQSGNENFNAAFVSQLLNVIPAP